MTKKAKALLAEALKLPAKQRLELARKLEESVEGQDDAFELSPEWEREIERRIEGIVSGKTKGIPLEEMMAELRRELEKDRRDRGKATPR